MNKESKIRLDMLKNLLIANVVFPCLLFFLLIRCKTFSSSKSFIVKMNSFSANNVYKVYLMQLFLHVDHDRITTLAFAVQSSRLGGPACLGL